MLHVSCIDSVIIYTGRCTAHESPLTVDLLRLDGAGDGGWRVEERTELATPRKYKVRNGAKNLFQTALKPLVTFTTTPL